MVSTKPSLPARARYSTKETADILEVSRMTINRWQKSGMLRQGGMYKANGRAFYYGEEIVRCWSQSF